jgi:hypothetical protein
MNDTLFNLSGYAATAIALGRYHTCAIVASGTLKCWGNNDYGQLGIYNYNTQISPADVLGSGMARDTNQSQKSFYLLYSSGSFGILLIEFMIKLDYFCIFSHPMHARTSPSRGHRLGPIPHVRDREWRRSQVLGQQRLRPAGQRGHEPVLQPCKCEWW